MPTSMSDQRKGIFALILLSLVYSSMGLFARFLSTNFSILQQVYLRVFAAFFLGLIFFNNDLNFNKIKKIKTKEWILLIFRSIASYLLGVTLFSQAIITAKYSNVSFISALPFTALLGYILLKEKLNWQKLLYILTAFFGVILISVKDYSNLLDFGKGEIAALFSAFFFAISYIARRWHSNLLNNKEITQITFFLSSIMLVTLSWGLGEGVPSQNWSLPLLFAVLGAGLFNVINMFLTNYGFQKVKTILASNILTLESVFGVVLGLIFYSEIPTLKELIGGLIIVVSVIAMNRLENSPNS